MASAGLKRPSDFDLNTPHTSGPSSTSPCWTVNKRRCTGFALLQSPTSANATNSAPISPNNSHHHHQQQHHHHHHQQQQQQHQTSGAHHHHLSTSPFKDPALILSSLSDDVTSLIKNEVHRAHHQQQQQQQQQQQPHNQQQHHDPPVLTMRQTQLICEKLIKDREQKLREEYDKILISKLAEQYDTFVKYTHDHIEKRYNQTNSHQASYLS